MKKRYTRKKLILHHPFQWKLAGTVLLAALISSVVTAFAVNWFYLFGKSSIQSSSNEQVLFIVLVATAAVIIVFLVRTLYTTHRIAGPIHKLESVVRDIQCGILPDQPLKFRAKDSFHTLAEQINPLFELIRSQQEEINRLKSEQPGESV